MDDLTSTEWIKPQKVVKDQPMELKYLAGEKTTVYMGQEMKAFVFSPVGKLPERYAAHLLKTRPKDFEIYVKTLIPDNPEVKKEEQAQQTVVTEEKPKLRCDICGASDFKNAQQLGSHKRYKHKENK